MKNSRENLNKKLDDLSEDQLEHLLKYIEYHFENDVIDPEIAEKKNEIYSIYKQNIAPLVNKIEVYEHRFSIDVYSGIEAIFRCMSSIESVPKSDALMLYSDLKKYAMNFSSQLSIRLIKLYIKVISDYSKVLTKFNYSGVCPKFKKKLTIRLRYIKKKLKSGSKLYKKRYKKEVNSIDYSYVIDSDSKKEQKALEKALKMAETLVEYCENNYSSIIDSKYANTISEKLFQIISITLTIFFSVVGVKNLIEFFVK